MVEENKPADEERLVGNIDFSRTLFLNAHAMTQSLQKGQIREYIHLVKFHKILLSYYLNRDNEVRDKIKELEKEYETDSKSINNRAMIQQQTQGFMGRNIDEAKAELLLWYGDSIMELLMELAGKNNLLLKESTEVNI